ncbi:hypothetical protein GWI33_020775 [Rhynchophorus ferrugineus]|uniref:Uncharacterized protein n=1 Tax=Rhynchophorus ferrugineus TaxID=354439 RepID=A0A834I2E2_RHYFE|nr:hypothetical protein GWI33_020775 [Rhynchophorus ferrugineus]
MRLYSQLVLWTYGILPTISLFILPHLLLTLAKAQHLRTKLISNALHNKIQTASALSKNQFRRYVPYNVHARKIRDLTMNIPMHNHETQQMAANQPEMDKHTFQRSSDALEVQQKFDFTNSDTEDHQIVDQTMFARMNSQPQLQHWGQQQESLGVLQNMWNMNSFGAHSNSGVLRNGDDDIADMKDFEAKSANPEPTKKKKKKKEPKHQHEYYPNYYGNYGSPYPYYGRESEPMNEKNSMREPASDGSQFKEMPFELQARAQLDNIQEDNPTNSKPDETVGCKLDEEDEEGDEDEKKPYLPYPDYERAVHKLEDINEKLKEDAKNMFDLPVADDNFYQSGYGNKNKWNDLDNIEIHSPLGEKSAEPHIHSKGFSHTHTITHTHRLNKNIGPPNEYVPVYNQPDFGHSNTHNSAHASSQGFNAGFNMNGGVGMFGQNGAHATAQAGLVHPTGPGYNGGFGQTNSHATASSQVSSFNHNIPPNIAPNQHGTFVSSLAGSQGGIIAGNGNTLVQNQIVGDSQQPHNDFNLQFNEDSPNEFFNRESEFSHDVIPLKINTKRKTVSLNEQKDPTEIVNKNAKYSDSSEESKEKWGEDSKELSKKHISKHIKKKFHDKCTCTEKASKLSESVSITLKPTEVTQSTTLFDMPSTEYITEFITQATTTPTSQASIPTTIKMLGMMNPDELTTTPFYIVHPPSIQGDKEKVAASLDDLKIESMEKSAHEENIEDFTDNTLVGMTEIEFNVPTMTSTPANLKAQSLTKSADPPNRDDLNDNSLEEINTKNSDAISQDTLRNNEDKTENRDALDINQFNEALEKNKDKLNLDDVLSKATDEHNKNNEDIKNLMHKDWSTLTDEEVEEIQFYKPEDEESIVGTPLNKNLEPETVDGNMVKATQNTENTKNSTPVQKRGPFESLEDKLAELSDEEKEEFMKQEFELISEVINESLRKRKLKTSIQESLNKKESATEDQPTDEDVNVASPNLINVRDNFDEYRREAEDWNDMNMYDNILGHKRAVPNMMSTEGSSNNGQEFINGFRKKRDEYYVPAEDLVANPNLKLNIPTTLDNLGSVAKYTFESAKSPIYHARNLAGNTKNIIMSAARIPPNNVFIPSKYEIVEVTSERDNSDIVSAINQRMLDSRSNIHAPDLPNEAINTEGRRGLIDAFTKLRDIIRVGVNSGRDTVRHAYDVSTDIRNLFKTTKEAIPNAVAHTHILKSVSPTVHQPLILTAPRIFDWSKNVPGESNQPANFLGIGNFLDSVGVSNQNQPEVPLHKIIVKPSETVLKSQQLDSKTVLKPKTIETWIQEPYNVLHDTFENEQDNSNYIKTIKDFLQEKQIYRETHSKKEATKEKRQIVKTRKNNEDSYSKQKGTTFDSVPLNYNTNLIITVPKLMKPFIHQPTIHPYVREQSTNDFTDNIFIEPEHIKHDIHENDNVFTNPDNQQNIRTSIIFNDDYKKPFMGLASRKQIQAFLNEYNSLISNNYENHVPPI